MVKKDGRPCTRNAEPSGMGFCWQHAPVKEKEDREKWKLRIDGAALGVAATGVLIKIIELAVDHLHEFFGPGDSQMEANSLAAQVS
jgi:hypothetical protein